MGSDSFDEAAPANDALLVQLVRTALGRRLRRTPRINISSCSSVVTLHGTVESAEERDRVEAAVRAVAGVEDVVNKLGVTQGNRITGAGFRMVHSGYLIFRGLRHEDGGSEWRARREGPPRSARSWEPG